VTDETQVPGVISLTPSQRALLTKLAEGSSIVHSQDGDRAWLWPNDPAWTDIDWRDMAVLRDARLIENEKDDDDDGGGRFAPAEVINVAGRAALAASCECCHGSGLEEVYAGEGAIREIPCSLCQTTTAPKVESFPVALNIETQAQVATIIAQRDEDDLASVKRYIQTLEEGWQQTREMLGRALEELRLIRMKDNTVVYDATLRSQAHMMLFTVPPYLRKIQPDPEAGAALGGTPG
jgi:hypothetical protein